MNNVNAIKISSEYMSVDDNRQWENVGQKQDKNDSPQQAFSELSQETNNLCVYIVQLSKDKKRRLNSQIKNKYQDKSLV